MAKIVAYDLCAAGKDYSGLFAAMQGYPNRYKITETCLLLDTTETAEMIFNKLRPHMDKTDRLFVTAVTPGNNKFVNPISTSIDAIKKVVGS